MMVSPGDSSVPANKLPTITTCAPAAKALIISPEYLIPPSAIIDTPEPSDASAQLATAVICGTPTPETTRVVQMEPGPIPTLTTSAPASINASVAEAVATLPAIISTLGKLRFTSRILSITP